jgi:hypothetical protein
MFSLSICRILGKKVKGLATVVREGRRGNQRTRQVALIHVCVIYALTPFCLILFSLSLRALASSVCSVFHENGISSRFFPTQAFTYSELRNYWSL